MIELPCVRHGSTSISAHVIHVPLCLGLSVGEIPSLMKQGNLLRHRMLYDLLSDCEILRLQFKRLGHFLSCYKAKRKGSRRLHDGFWITHDDQIYTCIGALVDNTKKNFIEQRIQDNVPPKLKANGNEDIEL